MCRLLRSELAVQHRFDGEGVMAGIAARSITTDCPSVQSMPAASCSTTDQVPLAHCWKNVPLIQFHIPSAVQGVPGIIG